MSLTPRANIVPPKEGESAYHCEDCEHDHYRMSTLLRATCPKFALVPWAEKAGRLGALAVYQQDGKLPADDDKLKKRIERLLLNADNLRDAGAERGNVVHDYLNRYVVFGEVTHVEEYDEAHRPYLRQLARFIIDYEPEFLESEFFVVHHDLNYAGKSDGICKIGVQPPRRNPGTDLTGKRVLFDVKSNREGRVYPPEHLYQVAGYELARRDMGAEPTEHQIVIAIGEDSYQVKVSHYTPESFIFLAMFFHSQREQEASQ